MLKIIKSRCGKRHNCPAVRICPNGALSQIKGEVPAVDVLKCISCGKCVAYCPKDVLIIIKNI